MNKSAASLQVKAIDREKYSIDFVLSTGTVDRHGEVIDPKGWRLENYVKNPVVLWGHDQSAFPIGRCENVRVESDQLKATVVFAYAENPDAAMVFELLAGKFLNAGSVGFMNLKWMFDEENDLLTLLENELYEFSIVNVPANPEALAKAVDALESAHAEKRVIDRVKDFSAKIKAKAEARFKNLGEEVTPEEAAAETAPDEDTTPEEKPEDITPEPEGEETPTQTAEEAAETEEAKAAIETICKASPTVLKEAMTLIQKALKDADKSVTTVDPTPAPQGRGKKVLKKSHINRAIRNLIEASK